MSATTNVPFPQTTPTPGFDAFSREVRRIHVTWLVWHRLFEDAPHDQKTFEQWPETWGHIRWSMLCTVIAGLCRLFDPQTMSGRRNLTVEHVWEEMDFGERVNLRKAACAAKTDCEELMRNPNFKQLRDRVLAHNDLANMLGAEVSDAEIETIRLAVEWLALFQWRCESLYEGRIVRYDETPSAVHRDCSLDRKIVIEVDAIVNRLK